MSGLTKKRCVPCEAGAPPLKPEEAERLQKEVPGWSVVDNVRIRREFMFRNFSEGLAFVNKIGEVAEQEDHHPDIELSYRKVIVTFSTHAIGGLSENDFIMAAKVSSVFS